MCGPHSNMSTCEVGTVLADSGPRVYQWVYSGSMVSILVFGITKGFTFTKTTLMASSALHDRVFDKVQSPCPSPWGAACISQSGGFTPIPCDAPDAVLGSGADTVAHRAYC